MRVASYGRKALTLAKYYKDLIAWKKAIDLVELIYRLTDKFPFSERTRLSDQLRRAAISVPSNIAEGQARYSPRDFARFLRTARASLAEIETQLITAARLGHLNAETSAAALQRADEVSRIVSGLLSAISAPAA